MDFNPADNILIHYACFNSNVKSSVFKGLHKVKSHFWLVILKTWLDNNTTDDIVQSVLWNNKFVKYENNVLFFRSWIEGGLLNVLDVIHNDRMLSFQEICRKLGNAPNRFLEYTVVCCAVKRFLRLFPFHAIGNTTEQHIPLFYGKKIYSARDFRKALVKSKTLEPCAAGFWRRKYNVEIGKELWTVATMCTKETRLRLLHWKLLHNIHPTNIMLYKMRVKENNNCSYCMGILDVIEHFFFECPIVL